MRYPRVIDLVERIRKSPFPKEKIHKRVTEGTSYYREVTRYIMEKCDADIDQAKKAAAYFMH